MTPPDAPQDDDTSNKASLPRPPTLNIPKTRSPNSNLDALYSPRGQTFTSNEDSRTRLSAEMTRVDESYESLTRSPILAGHSETGLHRIRHHPYPPPSSRKSSLASPAHSVGGPSPENSQPPSRTSSFPHLGSAASPIHTIGEDLTRFPSESLHSFSFAHRPGDTLYNRQNVLKRSLEFMRDRLNWAGSSPRIATAQARLAGDEELVSMLELLQQASLMGSDGPATAANMGLGIDPGPLTGPAHLANENVFEKSFLPADDPQSQSPASLGSSATITEEQSETRNVTDPKALAKADAALVNEQAQRELAPLDLSPTTAAEDDAITLPPPRPQRTSLKRTYTDVAGYSLQHKLTEAMAQPYHAGPTQSSIPDTTSGSFQPKPPARAGTMAASSERAPHGNRHKQSQAIFMTEGKAPWTITSANDLACLVFCVSRREVRTLGILEVVKPERRKWLEDRLRNPEGGTSPRIGAAAAAKQQQQKQQAMSPASGKHTSTSSSSGMSSAMGNGITAQLLSKPPSRWSAAARRSKTEGGPPPRSGNAGVSNHNANKSRGVLLCGDVIPIKKLDGATGSASVWVKEKGGGLIWVLEEIAEDVAYLTVDEIGSIVRGSGSVESIWGIERVRRGMDVQRLIPAFPKVPGTNTGAIDFDQVAALRRFTAHTTNSISIPITVEQISGDDDSPALLPGEGKFRVSSFPHIAGIIVLNPATMRVSSSNSVFSSALFGYASPDGMPITDLIPAFDNILRVMTDEDAIALVDGIVIPEHSFRRARALLALREGSGEAAAIFLRPSGVPARHRDGAEIMIDVQMRVVKSDRDPIYQETVIEEDETSMNQFSSPPGDLVYALWITYSRQLHAVNHGIGPVTPIISRPATPPQQPRPGTANRHIDNVVPTPPPTRSPAGEEAEELRTRLLKDRLEGSEEGEGEASVATSSSLSSQTAGTASSPSAAGTAQSSSDDDGTSSTEPYLNPSPAMLAAGAKVVARKTIDDFNILEEMGQGAYGKVKLARYKRSAAKKMVIKYVTKRRILVDTWHRDRRLGTVPLEIHVLDYLRKDGLQHPNIVEMADFFEDNVNYYIEMVPHGLPGMDLFDYIELRVTMDEDEARKIFVQVASALEHLHVNAKVVHRDIKDENVILDGEGRVKLVDFGSAAYIKSGPFDVFVGTIDYAAPEVLRGFPYRGKEQDVWALGILLYTIVYKENPFYSIDEIMDHDLRVPYILSEDCIDLIRKMLDRDVERRIGIQAVMEHPWCVIPPEEEEEEDDEDGEESGRGGLEMGKSIVVEKGRGKASGGDD